MARRRMLSEKLIYDEEYNSLSLNAQLVFLRILSVADDFGVVPANTYSLDKLINTPLKLKSKLDDILSEIVINNLGYLFLYEGKPFFMFKRESFDEINSYVINKRTKSEFLGLNRDTMLSENILEILGISTLNGSKPIESRKIKEESRKIKEGGSAEGGQKSTPEIGSFEYFDSIAQQEIPEKYIPDWRLWVELWAEKGDPITRSEATIQLKQLREVSIDLDVGRIITETMKSRHKGFTFTIEKMLKGKNDGKRKQNNTDIRKFAKGGTSVEDIEAGLAKAFPKSTIGSG